MLFLIALTVATTVSAVVLRGRDRREIARSGLGVALVGAGVSHFVVPTPFEQHLPDWTPTPELLVATSGAVEIGLGLALIVPSAFHRLAGRLTAVFLVVVFPANVHVAINDVDVDGQPGGPYPWIRLPFQALFIAWALWSTSGPEPPAAPSTRGWLPTLPWRERTDTIRGAGDDTVVMVSVLRLRRYRDVPAFLLAALRLRSRFHETGGLGLSLRAIPLRRTFWTLSQWADRADLDNYVGSPEHVAVMRRFAGRMADSDFESWTHDRSRPDWRQATQRLLRQHLAEGQRETRAATGAESRGNVHSVD